MKKFFEVVRDEQERVVSFTIQPAKKALEIVKIGSQTREDMELAKKVLNAVSDFHKFQRYSHAKTTRGLHLYKDSNLGSFRANNLGVVSVDYAGDLKIPVPTIEEYPERWAQLNVFNRRYFLTHIKPWRDQGAEARVNKHEIIDGLIEGVGFDVRVLPFGNNYAEHFIAMWEEEDMEKARKMRNEAFARSDMRETMYAPIRKAKAAGELIEDKPVEEARKVHANVVLKTVTNEEVDLFDLEIGSIVTVQNRRGASVNVTWDGSETAIRKLENATSAGFKVKIER